MLELRLLGEPLLRRDGDDAPLQLWRPHVALLALLALAPEGAASRAAVTRMLWPEVPERNARASLRQALFRLRRDVGEVVNPAGETLQLDAERLQIDVCEFERLLDCGRSADAVTWYGGEFLAGFSLGASLAFDQWADRERARLSARMAAASAALTESASERADWSEAIRWAEQWLAHEPCSEAAASRLLALRAQAGDAGGALGFYRGFCTRLREELNLSPSPELAALAERIRRTPPSAPPRLGAARDASASPAELPMVGRAAEFARLQARWEQAAAGRHQLVLITGEPGIGKTRLAREFTNWVRLQDATVLFDRAYEVEQGIPYAALTGVLRAALDAPGLAGVDAASLGELTRIVPEIAVQFRSGVVPPAGDLETGRVRLLEAVRLLFEALAFEAPIVLLLDDLPWADEATLATLHYLWRGLAAEPLLVLATARSAEIGANAALDRMLGTLRREAAAEIEQIPLTPLAPDAISRLAEAAGVPSLSSEEGDPLAALLERESGGNPLFLIEALRARAEGSNSPASREMVRTMVAELVARLSVAGLDLLRAAAVLGRRSPLPLAAAVASLPHADAVDALEELLRHRLLQRVEYEYDFVHDVLRQTVYASLGPERRRMLHRRAFERLAPDVGEVVGRARASTLAIHAVHGGLRPEAYHWLLRAAELARAVFAGAESERFLCQAEEFAESPAENTAVREQTGDLRRAQSRFYAAAVAYQEAIQHTEPGTTARLRLRIKLLDASLRSGILRLPQAAPAVETLLADAAHAGSDFLRDASRVAASAYLYAGDFPRAEEHALEAVEAARDAGDAAPLVRALLLRVQAGTLCRSLPDALPVLTEAVQIASEHELIRELCDAETECATELCRQGRWTEAIAAGRSVLQHTEAAGAVGAAAVAHLNLADVLLRRGEWEDATWHLDRAWTLSEQFDFPHVLVDVLVNRAQLAWHRGDAAETAAQARRALARAGALGMSAAKRAARALLALALLDEGDAEGARRALGPLPARAEPHHPTWGDDRELTFVANARLLASDGDHAAAALTLADALEVVDEPYATAMLTLELSALTGKTDVEAGACLAREAAAILARLEASPLLSRAAALLTAYGAPEQYDRGRTVTDS